MSKRITANIPEHVSKSLRQLAARNGVPVSALVIEALREWPAMSRELERGQVASIEAQARLKAKEQRRG